jgi:hypothetical protein
VQTGTRTRGEIEVVDHSSAAQSIKDNDSDVYSLLMALSAPFVDRQMEEIKIINDERQASTKKRPMNGENPRREISMSK